MIDGPSDPSVGQHRCHAINCHNGCPPKWLMCPHHWDMVPGTMQATVYNTLKLRRRVIDGSWAPWWRAQATAIAYVAAKEGMAVAAYFRREMAFADRLEQKQRAKDAKSLS